MFSEPIFYSDTKLTDRFIFKNKRFIFWFLQKRRGLCCPDFIPKSVSPEFQVFLHPEILFFTEKSFYIIGNCSAAHGPKRLEISRNCLHELRAEALGFFNIIETSATLCVIQNTKYMYRFTIFIVVLGIQRWYGFTHCTKHRRGWDDNFCHMHKASEERCFFLPII